MLKTNSFLLSAKSRAWITGIIYCVLAAVFLACTPEEVKAEEKTTSVVYAQPKLETATAIPNAQIETINETHLPIEEMNHFEESAEAMQLDIANEIALKEKTKREKEEQKKKEEERKKKEEERKKKEEEKRRKEREARRITLSKEDKEVLLRIVEAEATGEDIKGKILVANVVLNRVNSSKFPNTVKKVVFANRQFSPIRDGRYYKVSISSDTKKAVERALDGEDYSKGALYFMSRKYANSKNVRWFDTKLTFILKHGTHEFFK